MPDPIRDALRAAALATMTAAEREHSAACHNGQPGPGHIKRAAETVVAFLESLPIRFNTPLVNDDGSLWGETAWAADWAVLAAAVERAAQGDKA